jgi:hypothetical protein
VTSRISSAVVTIALLTAACGGAVAIRAPEQRPTPDEMKVLWSDPGSEPRDLFWGIGGQKYAPKPDATFTFKSRDDLGFSSKYRVTDPDGVDWSAKLGPEAQTEVVLSRVLWGLGYHQPPIYYLPSWKVDRDGEVRVESEARFRPKVKGLEEHKQYWWWQQNPFVGTHELNGLLVVLLMFNSTDLKNDNNSVYKLAKEKGVLEGPDRWFAVRDLGASLGETGALYPRRNWLEGFEQHGFITAINGESVQFDYQGRHQELISMIHPADVRWAAEHLARLTDGQWHDAFRAANYSEGDTERFLRKIKEKIADGLALRAREVDERATR